MTSLERKLDSKNYEMKDIQELANLYIKGIELFQVNDDPIYLYFLDKIQNLIKVAF